MDSQSSITTNKGPIIKYIVISAILSLLSFLIVRIGDNLLYTALLRMNGIFHDYKLFDVIYLNGRGSSWTEGMIIFIHTLPSLIYTIAAVMLPHYLFPRMNWFARLTVSWVSFHLILMVSSSLISGLFEYYGLGVALKWLFVNTAVRILGVTLILLAIFYAIRRFAWYFLRSAPSHDFVSEQEKMRFFLQRVVLFPFILTFPFILPLATETTILDFGVALPLGLIMIWIIYGTVSKVWIPDYEL